MEDDVQSGYGSPQFAERVWMGTRLAKLPWARRQWSRAQLDQGRGNFSPPRGCRGTRRCDTRRR